PADHRPRRQAPLQRGQLHRRVRARPGARRQRRRRLEAGDHRAGLRAQRAGALSLVDRADPRARPRGEREARRPRDGGDRPDGGKPGDAARDVDVGRRHAPGRGDRQPGGGGRQGRRHHLRAVDPRAGARAARPGADARHGIGPAAGAGLHHADRPVVLAARRYPRNPSRHHRARAGPPMSDLRSLLSDTVTRLFTDLATKELIEAAEKGTWPDKLWRALEEGGLTLPLVSEDAGGAGGTWLDAHVVIRAAGRYTAPVPIAETIVAAWLLSRAGLEVPFGPLTLAPVRRAERLSLTDRGGGVTVDGRVTRVPWGRDAGHVVTVGDLDGRPTVALIARGAATIEEDRNLALEP